MVEAKALISSSLYRRLRPIFIALLLYSNEVLTSYANVASSSKTASQNTSKPSNGNFFKNLIRHQTKSIKEDVDTCIGNDSGVCEIKTDMAKRYRGGHSHTHHVAGEAVKDSSLTIFKLLLTACLTSLNVACWFVPLKVKRFTESKLAISLANAFSGGVFLSLAFGHMIPHASHGFEDSNFPSVTPYYLTLTGYLVIFFVEKIAFDTHDILHDHDHDHVHSTTEVSTEKDTKISTLVQATPELASSGRSAVVLLLALSVHSLFETMALGLSSSKINAILLATSIGLHQPAESLALLVSFLKTGLPQNKIIKMLGIFSCVGPLGVLFGVAVAQYAGRLMDAVLVSLAAGTFIYVGATEVVADEFENPQHKWKKFGSLISGVIIIGYIISWTEALEGRVS